MGQFSQFIINHWLQFVALIIVLGIIFLNERQGQKNKGKELSPQSVVKLINDDGVVIIDLRDAESYRKGHIIDAIRATEEDFEKNSMDKYKDKKIILVCARGLQSASLAVKLRSLGFTDPMILSGGMNAWLAADLPVIKGK